MKKMTHIVIGVTVGALLWHISPFSSYYHMLLFMSLGGFFGIVPDFDILIGLHRKGYTHGIFSSAIGAAIIYFAWNYLADYYPISAVPANAKLYIIALAFLAFLGHVLSDVVTDAGIALLCPFSKVRISLTPINSNNSWLNGFMIVVCFAVVILLVK